jgi:hypothetical protein
LSVFSTLAHEFEKVVFNGQSRHQDLPEEIDEVCPPSSSSCSEGDNLRQLTTQETNSPEQPVNEPYFVIDESDFDSEEEETVDEGSLPVMNVAN